MYVCTHVRNVFSRFHRFESQDDFYRWVVFIRDGNNRSLSRVLTGYIRKSDFKGTDRIYPLGRGHKPTIPGVVYNVYLSCFGRSRQVAVATHVDVAM